VDESSVIQGEADDRLAFFGARSVEFDASIQPYRVTPLVFADPAFYGEIAYADFVETGILEFNVGADLRGPELAVAVAVELESTGARIVLIGDRQFVTNGSGLQTSPPNSPNFVYPGNVRFTLNSIGWLLGNESGLPVPLTFSTPAPTATEAPVVPTNTPAPTDSLEPETTAEPEATEDANTGS
jgi:hypothetical protein